MIHDTASAILLSYPGTRPVEAWMCFHLAAKYSSHRLVPTEEAVLTLPLLAHLCATMLSTYAWMCAKGAILGAEIRSCMSSAPRSGFLLSHLLWDWRENHACLGGQVKGGFPKKVLALWVLVYPSHSVPQ